MAWTKNKIKFLTKNYPIKGKMWCCKKLGFSEASVRHKAHALGLKQDKKSPFFLEWQNRAKKSKIGKKRPLHAKIMKKLYENGAILQKKQTSEEISERMKNQWIVKPHPRGMAGKKHKKETLEKISQSSKIMWGNMTEKMKDDFSMRASINGIKIASKNRIKTSWHCGHREIGDVKRYYRSAWEANYARYLEFLKNNGDIIKWEHEPTTFWFDSIKRGVKSYLPDFKVTEINGDVSYHEVKGWMDDKSKTKIKRMAKYHPSVKLIIIDSKAYSKLSSQISMTIQGWEHGKKP